MIKNRYFKIIQRLEYDIKEAKNFKSHITGTCINTYDERFIEPLEFELQIYKEVYRNLQLLHRSL